MLSLSVPLKVIRGGGQHYFHQEVIIMAKKVSKIKNVVVPCGRRDSHGDGARNKLFRKINQENHRPKPPETENPKSN